MPLTFDNSFLRKLERFEILPPGLHRGGQMGHRRSLNRGTGLEFADHKEYSAGDDIRYLDWNLYARLEEEFVKLFEQEEALPVYLLLDRSGSMGVGNPSKLHTASLIAAALAYVGLTNQDHVRVSTFAQGLLGSTKFLRGKTHIYEILDLLDTPADGQTDLAAALDSFSTEARVPGVVFILSDFLDPGEILRGVRLLAGRRFGIVALHLVADEERTPDLSGDAELLDVEDGRTLQVALRNDTLARFAAFFESHCDGVRDELRRYGVRYLWLNTRQPVDEILFTRFPKEGVLK